VRLKEVRPAEVRLAEVRPDEVRLKEVRAAPPEVRPGEVRDARVLLTPGVPGVVVVRHASSSIRLPTVRHHLGHGSARSTGRPSAPQPKSRDHLEDPRPSQTKTVEQPLHADPSKRTAVQASVRL
jgi:hypothetical protein